MKNVWATWPSSHRLGFGNGRDESRWFAPDVEVGGDLLAPIYSWFTEGFDTPDPKGARVLLDELR